MEDFNGDEWARDFLRFLDNQEAKAANAPDKETMTRHYFCVAVGKPSETAKDGRYPSLFRYRASIESMAIMLAHCAMEDEVFALALYYAAKAVANGNDNDGKDNTDAD